jgi:hypothetical protein
MDTKSSPVSAQSSNSNPVSLVLTFCVISALLIFLVYSENFVFGSKLGNWTYPYFETIKPISHWITLIIFLFLSSMIFVGSKLIFVYEKLTLLGSFLIAVLIQILIHKAYPISLGIIVQSDTANSFYSVAMHFSPVEILEQYNNLVSQFPSHAGTNMPGKILLFQFLKLFTTSPQIMGYLIISLSTLGASLLYGICKILFHDRQTAFYAFILYTLIPCKLFFFPILNTVTPLFILICVYLYLLYIERKKYLFLLLMGGALYILILFEPSPLITGIIFIGILFNALGEMRLSKKDFWGIIILPILAFLVVHILSIIIFSFNLFQTVLNISYKAVIFNVIVQRDYWIWVRENVKEFFYAGGIPIMMIFIYLTTQILSQWEPIRYKNASWEIENVLVLSILVTFCMVLFLGINRGEITRLWIYLAVFFQVPASFFLAKIPKSNALFFFVASTLVVQSIITLQRVGFIIP